MTVRQKAKQLALTLVGEDQNPGPLIETLIEMAEWQRKKIAHEMYNMKKNSLEAAIQELCTTDCLAYRQGICPYLAKRKALCPRIKALLVDLER